MITGTYYKPNITKEWIRKSPFRYSFPDGDEEAYTYKFPVYKKDNKTLLESEIILFNKSEDVFVNVFRYGTNEKYCPYYSIFSNKNSEIIKKINRNILKEFHKLGIEKRKFKKDKKYGKVKN